MKVSIGIPTFNRVETLKECLSALEAQTYPKQWIEVIIVDDGSQDGTQDYLKKSSEKYSFPMIGVSQANLGPAAARNAVINNSSGDVILMMDDDIIATDRLVEEHISWHGLHRRREDVVLGRVTWSPRVRVSDLMWWCENGGPMTRYYLLEGRVEADFEFFYSGNISLKRDFLRNNLFDETFPFGFDDLELGYRLQKQGMKLYYNKAALAYHYRTVTMEEMLRRMRIIAKAAHHLHRKWPELRELIHPRSLVQLRLLKGLSTVLYPLAMLTGWKRMTYHHRYQNQLSTEFSQAYYRSQ